MNETNIFQKKLLDNCNKFVQKLKKKNIDIALNPECFFTIWAKTPGQITIKNILGKKKSFSDYFFIFKNIISVAKNHDLEIISNHEIKSLNKIKIIISYSSKKNFDKRGIFHDQYFNISSKEKNIIWFLISLDNFTPKKINKNLLIVRKKKDNSASLIYLLKYFFILICQNITTLSKIKNHLWFENNFALQIQRLFNTSFKNKNITRVLFNYESTPWQNNLINYIKKKNRSIKTIGYLHCAPWPIQTDLMYRNIKLDQLYVSGEDQKLNLVNYLGWNKKKIKVIPSLRFLKSKEKIFRGYIFPPYNLEKKNTFLERFENYISRLPNKSLNYMKIRIHPLNKKSETHLKFKKNIEAVVKRYKKKFTKKGNFSIFFGSATGVCVQALEEGTKIIHFPNCNLLDVFSESFWRSIKTKKIYSNIYEYELKKYKRMFLTNFETNKFKKYLLF